MVVRGLWWVFRCRWLKVVWRYRTLCVSGSSTLVCRLSTTRITAAAKNGIPSAETLAAVQAHVDAVRPVTRKNGFLALAPSIQTVNVAVTITLSSGTDTDTATAAIKSAVNAYFDALKPGDTLIKSQLETLISEVYGVRDRVLTTPVGNIKPQESAEDIYWLRPGSINVEYTT